LRVYVEYTCADEDMHAKLCNFGGIGAVGSRSWGWRRKRPMG